MNQSQSDHWKSVVLDEIFAALAASAPVREALVFKGARVLNLHLGGGRQSLDLDSNLAEQFVLDRPNRAAQREFLEREISLAVRRHFEGSVPVRFSLTDLKIRDHPPGSHPLGWDAFKVRLNVNDLTREVRGLPALDVDVAAPEKLSNASVRSISVRGNDVQAYTLERITGEKLRAFLSSLPAYRIKVRKRGETVRAKDLFDISRIHRAHGLEHGAFWRSVGAEFRAACQSRYIDCEGLRTFQEQWQVTRKSYDEAPVPKDIDFGEVEATLVVLVRFLEAEGILPFSFPLPQS